MSYFFTSESVSEGHPDKVSDRISDMVVDSYISGDPYSRVACETLTTTNKVVLAGEVRGPEIKKDELIEKVRNCIKDIGYDQEGFTWKEATKIESHLHSQSADIAMGVDSSGNKDEGAGDQGMMFGFAINETPELMPLPIMLSHKLTRRLATVRKDGTLDYLRPDGKSQVTVEYENGKPKRVHTVVISTQHGPDVAYDTIRKDVIEHIIKPICGDYMDEETIFHINPTGQFIIGGPPGDCGLTGRKIIVDTYGGTGRHGGGAFSGKDPSKVDRSGAYAARYVAKNIVAAGLADKCEVQLAYAIGVVEPVSIHVDTFGTGKVDEAKIVELVREHFDLTPRGIIDGLDLRRPIYKKTAAYGHFGREEASFSWERIDKADILRKAAGLTESVEMDHKLEKLLDA